MLSKTMARNSSTIHLQINGEGYSVAVQPYDALSKVLRAKKIEIVGSIVDASRLRHFADLVQKLSHQ